jgi:hypothetical protein
MNFKIFALFFVLSFFTKCLYGTSKHDTIFPELIIPIEDIGDDYFAAISNNKKLIVSISETTIKIWDYNSKRLIKMLSQSNNIFSVKFSEDDKLIIFEGDQILVLDTSSLEFVFGRYNDPDLIYDCKVSSNGNFVVFTLVNGITYIVDRGKKQLVDSIKFSDSSIYINHLSISKNNKLLSLSASNGYSYIYSLDELKIISKLNNKGKRSYHSNFNSKSDILFSYSILIDENEEVSEIRTRNVWDLKRKRLINSFKYDPNNYRLFESESGLKYARYNIKRHVERSLEIFDYQNNLIKVIPKVIGLNTCFFYNHDQNLLLVQRAYNLKNVGDKITGIRIKDESKEFEFEGQFVSFFNTIDEQYICYRKNKKLYFFCINTLKEFSTNGGNTSNKYISDFSIDGDVVNRGYNYNMEYLDFWNIYSGRNIKHSVFSSSIDSIQDPFDKTEYNTLMNEYKVLKKSNFTEKEILYERLDIEKEEINSNYLTSKYDIFKLGEVSPLRYYNIYNKNTYRNMIITVNEKNNIVDSLKLIKYGSIYNIKFYFENNLLTYSPFGVKDTTYFYSLSPLKFLFSINNIDNVIYNPNTRKIYTSYKNEIGIFDFDTNNLDTSFTNHIEDINSLIIINNGKHLVSTSDDNTTIWDLSTKKWLYTRYQLLEGNWLCLDPEFRYDGSENARKELYFTCGTEIIELDQLKEELYVPNLVERIMKGETIENKKISDLDICDLLPKVEEIEDGDTLHYKYKIIPRRGGIGKIEISVNDKGVVQTLTKENLIKKNDYFELNISKKEYQDKNLFIPGEQNTIKVKAYTQENKLSSRGSIRVDQDNRPKLLPPNVYAVFIGVNKYKGEGLDLQYASKDAQTLSSTFTKSSLKLFNTTATTNNVFTYNLCDLQCEAGTPEKRKIERIIAEVADSTKSNDIVFIFFAGHGKAGTGDDKNYYFLTSDASPLLVENNLASVSISTTELRNMISVDKMEAQKLVFVFDACQSGQMIESFFRNEIDENGRKVLEFDKMNEKSGMYILTSSSSNQASIEMSKYGHGLMTYSMLKTLKENTNLNNERGYLSINKWFEESIKTLEDIARKDNIQQRPNILTGSDFSIGIVDDEVRSGISLGEVKLRIGRCSFNNGRFSRSLEEALRSKCDSPNSDCLFNINFEGSDVYFIEGSYAEKGGIITCSVEIRRGNETLFQKEYNQSSQQAMIEVIKVDFNKLIK